MTSYFAPRQAESAEVLALDMQSLFLTGSVFPFGAKLRVDHVFRSSEKSRVEVIYSFPLPRDASLTGFQIAAGDFKVSSRLERVEDAQRRYEEALEEGSLSAVTQQNPDGLVNLTVGNLRPGETIAVRLDFIAGLSLNDAGYRLRFPFTVAPCYHPRMRASSDGYGIGTLELPERLARGTFLPPFHADASRLHNIGFDLRIQPSPGVQEIASPSHPLRVSLNGGQGAAAKLCPEREVPNRDLILDVRQQWGMGCAWSDRASGGRKHFAVLAPSAIFGEKKRAARRIVFLLDRSGSMSGTPIEQARQAIDGCLAKLLPEDEFGVIAFDESVESFQESLLPASLDNIEKAIAFLGGIDARGGTELASGIEAGGRLLMSKHITNSAAADELSGSGRGELFVLTDGQVSETVEILRRARKCEIRLFCLGIGSASQDRFLELLARQTGGVCRFVSPVERIDAAARELFAALGGSVGEEVRIAAADTQPYSDGCVFSGTPFFAYGDIHSETAAAVVEWKHGSRILSFEPLDNEVHGLIERLRGAKSIADLEARSDYPHTKCRERLVALSEHYGLASSEMSLVAVMERADDRRGELPKTKLVPVGMPKGTEPYSYFGKKTRVFFEESRAEEPMFRSRVHACEPAPKNRPLACCEEMIPPKLVDSELAVIVHEAIALIDQHTSIRTRKDVNIQVGNLLRLLVAGETVVKGENQIRVLEELIAFMSSDVIDLLDSGRFDTEKWRLLRNNLEAAWPAALKTLEMDVSSTRIRPGMDLETALHIFEDSVNQPGTMFSTDHWLTPRLGQLRKLLDNPITEDQAAALLDVLHERRWMRELLAWLDGPRQSWQAFLVFSKCS